MSSVLQPLPINWGGGGDLEYQYGVCRASGTIHLWFSTVLSSSQPRAEMGIREVSEMSGENNEVAESLGSDGKGHTLGLAM